MTFRKLFAVLGIGALTLMAGCGSQDSSTEQAEQRGTATDAVLRLDFLAGGAHAGLFLARERGYYEEEGLDIDIQDGRGSAVSIQQVASGTDDFAWASQSSLIAAVNSGMPVKSVAVVSNRNTYGVAVDEGSGIDSLEDLKGKRLLVVAGTPDVYLLEALLESNGLNPDDVELQNVDASSKISLYAQGEGDGVVTLMPFAQPIIAESRPSSWLMFADFGQVLVDYGLVANTQLIENDPELVQGFVRASLRGWEEALHDPDSAVDAVLANRPDLDAAQVRQQYDLATDFFASDRTKELPVGCAAEQDWKDSIELLAEFADMPDLDSSEVDRFYTSEFVPGCDPLGE